MYLYSPINAPLTDLVLGASIYFPPMFKTVMLGLVL
ncbi:putative inner membrane protein [Yersinia bercovieri]|nr:putative inner membrane protein [Yersinia bercovieri]